MGRKVQKGDTVKVDYTGRLENGEIFDTSLEEVAKENGVYHETHSYTPIEFRVGSGSIIEGFEEAVLGMEEGETKTVRVPPEKGYGKREPQLVWRIPSEAVSGEKPKEGSYVSIQGRPARVVEVTDESITLDLNHPLAGRTLTFEITLREIA